MTGLKRVPAAKPGLTPSGSFSINELTLPAPKQILSLAFHEWPKKLVKPSLLQIH